MQGYVVVPQWYAKAKKLSDLPGNPAMTVLAEEPGCPYGDIVFQVEDDGSLVLVATNFDSSD